MQVGPGFDGANTVAGADFSEYEKQFGAAGIIYNNTGAADVATVPVPVIT